MKKIACLVVSVVLPLCVFAQSSPSDAHMKAIWGHINARLNSQTDIWFKKGYFPTCINLLRYEYEEDPSNYDIATNLGWMLENVHLWDKALAIYVRFRKDNPTMADAAFPEAYFYFEQKAYSKVPPLLQPTISRHPFANSYRLLAHSYEKLGLYPDALTVWKQLVVDYPQDAAAKLNMEKIAKKVGGTNAG